MSVFSSSVLGVGWGGVGWVFVLTGALDVMQGISDRGHIMSVQARRSGKQEVNGLVSEQERESPFILIRLPIIFSSAPSHYIVETKVNRTS